MPPYWTEFAKILLPGLLLMSVSAVPLALGTLAAVRRLRKAQRFFYLRNVWGSIAAGAVALQLLLGTLFGNAGSSSSTAGLIFLFAPIYSAIALGAGYGMAGLAYGKEAKVAESSGTRVVISPAYRYFILVPIAMLGILLFGVVKHSVQCNDLAVAERASNPETLQRVLDKAMNGKADSIGVPLFLAQNPNTSAAILEQLSRHEHPSVRVFVARHPNTSLTVLARMSNDCDPEIRLEAQRRIKVVSESNPLVLTPECSTTGGTP